MSVLANIIYHSAYDKAISAVFWTAAKVRETYVMYDFKRCDAGSFVALLYSTLV